MVSFQYAFNTLRKFIFFCIDFTTNFFIDTKVLGSIPDIIRIIDQKKRGAFCPRLSLIHIIPMEAFKKAHLLSYRFN